MRSLLRVRVQADGAARYEMLATIRDDARDRLRGAGEEGQYAQRHAAYFAGFAGDEAAMTREIPNVRAALTWTRGAGNSTLGMELMARFGRIWYLSGLLSELRDWLETLLALDAANGMSAPPALRANALFGAARVAYDRGESEHAADLANRSLQAARDADDAEDMSNAFVILGQIAQRGGDVSRADELFEEGLAWARMCDNLHVLNAALGFRAESAQAEGNMALAVALHEEALQNTRQIGSLWGEALTETHLGRLAFAQQRYQRARQHYRQRTGPLSHLRQRCLPGVVPGGRRRARSRRGQPAPRGDDQRRDRDIARQRRLATSARRTGCVRACARRMPDGAGR